MEKIKKLSKVEHKVISALETDARQPFSRIGKKIKTSEQRVSYTISSLQKKEILKAFYSLIDYSRMSMLNFRVFFKVTYVDEKKLQELLQYLIDEPHTSWVTSLGGRYDLVCTFFAYNPSQFNKVFKGIIEKFPQQLQNYSVLTTIVMRYFGKKTFSGVSDELIIGGDREPYSLNNQDLFILSIISNNARKSSVDIAAKLKVTPKTVIQKIKNLQTLKVIRGFKPFLDLSSVQYTTMLLMIKYHNVSVHEEVKLLEFLKQHPLVLTVVKLLGQWDLQIEIQVQEMKQFRKLEIEIRKNFSNLISEIETLLVYQEHKKTFFPAFLIQTNNEK